MRTTFAAALLLSASALTSAQPPKDEPVVPKDPLPRYGVKARVKQYPQTSAKETLKSALTAVEAADYPYLVAHILDPKFVDDAVAERAKLFQAGAEAELAQLRDFQR